MCERWSVRETRRRSARAVKRGLWLAVLLIVGAGGWPATAAETASGTTLAMASPLPAAVRSSVVARIDLSDQTMDVYVAERLRYTFPVSTGRGRYRTPTGHWRAQWLSPNHRSRKYNNAPMPWSVFFYRGYAVHGTTEVKRLGQPASHGCVRLHPDNARIFYELVRNNGKANTLISVVQ